MGKCGSWVALACLAVAGCYQGVGDGKAAAGDGALELAPCEVDSDCAHVNPCAVSVCGPELVCVPQAAVMSNACRPEIEVDHPPRAATLQGSADEPVVLVTGRVRSPAAPIEGLTINGTAVEVGADGRFSHAVAADVGGNVLVLETTDAVEQTRKRVQSFLWSTQLLDTAGPEGGMVDEGLAFWLDQEVLDDNDVSLPHDDLASVLNLVLASLDVGSLFDPNKPVLKHSGYDVYIKDLWFDANRVRLGARDGGLDLAAGLIRTQGKLYYHCTCSGLSCPCWYAGGSSHGGFSIALVRFDGSVDLQVDSDHRLDANIADVRTRVETIEVWSNKGWTNFIIQAAMTFVEGQVASRLESELTRAVRQQVGPALENVLGDLSLALRFAFPRFSEDVPPAEVDLVADFLSTDFHDGVAPPEPSPPRGGGVHFRIGTQVAETRTPHPIGGVVARAGCGSGALPLASPRTSPIELAINDDVVNHFLHAGWRGGLLEIPLKADVYDIRVSGMLPPVISDCGGPLRAHIGDVKVDATVDVLGREIAFEALVSMMLQLEVGSNEDTISLDIVEVERVEIELTAKNDANIVDEPAMIGLLEQRLVDELIGKLGDGLGGFEIPTVDLSGAVGLPPGTAVLRVSVDHFEHADGVTQIAGSL